MKKLLIEICVILFLFSLFTLLLTFFANKNFELTWDFLAITGVVSISHIIMNFANWLLKEKKDE